MFEYLKIPLCKAAALQALMRRDQFYKQQFDKNSEHSLDSLKKRQNEINAILMNSWETALRSDAFCKKASFFWMLWLKAFNNKNQKITVHLNQCKSSWINNLLNEDFFLLNYLPIFILFIWASFISIFSAVCSENSIWLANCILFFISNSTLPLFQLPFLYFLLNKANFLIFSIFSIFLNDL